ncbi:Cloroperoxidase [Sistotremastrum suecicum HHB10207 ss-3]|uniref:Cloroperoxidase n=1 Tax=Sistotremastrum suecicum HHB10207 ss-3 TaxID=1314776 RepID=A0A166GHJ8_9AGAM|nr:Cloroperoxidase [Sistotremastrum suecicum HHB10207 ss-3]
MGLNRLWVHLIDVDLPTLSTTNRRMLTITTTFLLAASAFLRAAANPVSSGSGALNDIDGQRFVQINVPSLPTDTSLKVIPDAQHPFVAPGPNDKRGPCPGLNTLANHGYLPHNGIASFEQLIYGVEGGYNMEHDLASALSALAILARGNAFINLVSIGGVSDQVPPLPGKIDGPTAGGLSKHGRFEGDVSLTRHDIGEGDYQNFQDKLYDQFLTYVGRYGGDSPTSGNASVVTLRVLQEYKYHRFLSEQASDPNLEFSIARMILSYDDAAFLLNFFANGTENIVDTDILGSFFRNQTFPPNWHRRGSPGDFTVNQNTAAAILSAHPLVPGTNKDGVWTPDAPLNTGSTFKDVHLNIMQNLASSLNTVTGDLKTNVETLLAALAKPFGVDPTKVRPKGTPGQ